MDTDDVGGSDVVHQAHQARETPETVGALLRISNEIARLHKEHFGKGPDRAQTHRRDDLLITVLHGGTTTVERTMSSMGRQQFVLDQRHAFQQAMEDRFRAVVREALGEEIRAFLSANHEDPKLSVEIFLLESSDA